MSTLLEIKPTVIEFVVYGTPRPQGSMRMVPVKGYDRPFITSDNKKLKPWRKEVAGMASIQAPGVIPFPAHVPVELTLNFYFTKPKSSKRRAMTTKPDSSKLWRAVEDALTGIIFHDDSQVVEAHVRKHYGGPERCEIVVREAIV